MKKDLSKPILFIGAERVGKAVLRQLLGSGQNVVAVVTAHPSLKKRIADYVDFSDLQKKYPRVAFHYVKNSKSPSVVKKIKSHNPEAIFVVSWSQIIPDEVLKVPSKGVIGLHYSYLPKRRGCAPLNWAIIDGLREFGITLYHMNEKIDAGDIIAQRKIRINNEDTVSDLLIKIEKIAPDLISKYLSRILTGKVLRIKQNEKKATYTKRRAPKDSEIDLSWTTDKVVRYIRALAPPYPCAFIKANGKKIYFTAAKCIGKNNLKIEGIISKDDK